MWQQAWLEDMAAEYGFMSLARVHKIHPRRLDAKCWSSTDNPAAMRFYRAIGPEALRSNTAVALPLCKAFGTFAELKSIDQMGHFLEATFGSTHILESSS